MGQTLQCMRYSYREASILSWKFVFECSCLSLEKPTPTTNKVSFLFSVGSRAEKDGKFHASRTDSS